MDKQDLPMLLGIRQMELRRTNKANHALDDYSARDLLVQLAQCKNPYNCPHGRPVLVIFTTLTESCIIGGRSQGQLQVMAKPKVISMIPE